MKIDEVIFRQDLYPRFEPNQQVIERYALSVEMLPPIKVNQNGILIDGFHRWKAHQLAKCEEIDVEIIKTESEAKLETLAYQLNSIHGLQLNSDEKQAYAQKKIGLMSAKEIGIILSVTEKCVNDWTKSQRDAIKKERNRRILEEYLRAWNTQEKVIDLISDIGVINQSTISTVIKSFIDSTQFSKINNDFEPYIYAIWKLEKKDKETTTFGYFPEIYMENLLYYHTEPMDVIYDPFAGSGTTVDMCKKWLRRYYCSDRIVAPGREAGIKQWDISQGLPDDLPRPDLAFLDPPYWKQAEGKYSDDKECLGNMSLEEFYQSMYKLLDALIAKKSKRIAIVIQSTQYKNDLVYEGHIFEFVHYLREKYDIEIHRILPYSSQQYTPQCVEKAKERKVDLLLHRDLIVWKIKENG